jgi:hypothetical protein
VAPHRRAARLVNQARSAKASAMTVLVGVDSDVLHSPLIGPWWRSDAGGLGAFGG